MKCKFRFPAKATVQFELGLVFQNDGKTYEIEIDENKELVAFSVTVHNYPDECLPSITPLTGQLAKASINIPEDSFSDAIIEEVRAIEGGLCFWGLQEIDVDSVKREWIPESADDEKKLQLFSFSTWRRPRWERSKAAAQLDLFVRTVLVRKDLLEWETPLNFYRRGRIDLADGYYIEAIHDIYFALETLMANGKFKKAQVKEEFKKSKELLDAIAYLQGTDPREHCPNHLLIAYDQKFVRRSADEIIDYIIETRGFLHHHTRRRTGMWHPARQRDYHVDAVIFTNICTRVLMSETVKILFLDDKKAVFRQTTVTTPDGDKVSWPNV